MYIYSESLDYGLSNDIYKQYGHGGFTDYRNP